MIWDPHSRATGLHTYIYIYTYIYNLCICKYAHPPSPMIHTFAFSGLDGGRRDASKHRHDRKILKILKFRDLWPSSLHSLQKFGIFWEFPSFIVFGAPHAPKLWDFSSITVFGGPHRSFYYSMTLLLYYPITCLLYYFITLLLIYFVTLLLYSSIIIFLHYWYDLITLVVYLCITIVVHCY